MGGQTTHHVIDTSLPHERANLAGAHVKSVQHVETLAVGVRARKARCAGTLNDGRVRVSVICHVAVPYTLDTAEHADASQGLLARCRWELHGPKP